MVYVFLSYSRKDLIIMQQLHDDLLKEHIEVWVDEKIKPGTQSWKQSIENAIKNATCLICLLSPDAAQSRWVREELDFAEAQNKRIFLVLVRGDETNAIPFGFSTHQWIDIRENYVSVQKLLIPNLKNFLTETSQSDVNGIKDLLNPENTYSNHNNQRKQEILKFRRNSLKFIGVTLFIVSSVTIIFLVSPLQFPIINSPTSSLQPHTTTPIHPREQLETMQWAEFFTRIRPLTTGYSATGGTIGLFVRDVQGIVYLVTPSMNIASDELPGAPAFQPSEEVGARFPDDVIGYFEPLRSNTPLTRALGLVRLTEGIDYRNSVHGIKSPSEVTKVRILQENQLVDEREIVLLNAVTNISIQGSRFNELITIEGAIMLSGGVTPNSHGALVIQEENGRTYAVGVIVAGTANMTVAIPVQAILDAYQVELATF